jgi:hypothetical protein
MRKLSGRVYSKQIRPRDCHPAQWTSLCPRHDFIRAQLAHHKMAVHDAIEQGEKNNMNFTVMGSGAANERTGTLGLT